MESSALHGWSAASLGRVLVAAVPTPGDAVASKMAEERKVSVSKQRN